MALGLLIRHNIEEPDVSKPNAQRRTELESAYHNNITDSKQPFQGVEIRTLGEVLSILFLQNWAGGLNEATPPGVLRRARWFTDERARRQVGPSTQANFAGAGLTSVNLRHADLRGALLTKASLPDSDLRDTNVLGADLNGLWLTGARLSKEQLIGEHLIDDARRRYIESQLALKMGGQRPPCEGMILQSRAELIWLFLRMDWSGEPACDHT